MAITATPPKYTSWAAMMQSIRQGEAGSWRVYAMQRVLNITADGTFGPLTAAALKGWQAKHGLVDDAIAGPATQRVMLKDEAAKIDANWSRVPDGLLDGFAREEGANILAATNWYTPPGGPVGVDCGCVQWRQYEPYTLDGLKAAFNPSAAFTHAASVFSGRIVNYTQRRPSLGSHRIVELAVLAHNAPFLTEQVVKNGRLSTPTAEAVWTTIPVDERSQYGGRVHYTHEEWSRIYPGRVLKGVTY